MAVLPKIVYNFNENNTSKIRDYSDNGNDANAANLTISSSTRVGNDAIFNSTTDQIDLSNITDLSGKAEMALHLGLSVQATAGTLNIVDKDAQLVVQYNYTNSQIEASLFVASGTAFVKGNVTIDVMTDIDINYVGDILTLYIDGVSIAVDATESGVIASNANRMYIGDDTTSNSALFKLNEFKLYDEAITTTIIAAVIAEQNGLTTDTGQTNNFAVGDIIANGIDISPKYAIVSYVGTNDDFRFYPITDNINSGSQFQRVGNLWDTTRQHSLKSDNTPQICFYDGVSATSEVFTDAKKVWCVSNNGVIILPTEVSTSVTITNTDTRIEVDCSGGDITITMPTSPIENKDWEIVDIGNANPNKIIVDGGAKNINGLATATITEPYEVRKMYYTGTEYIMI